MRDNLGPMRLAELQKRTILILGFGAEGQATFTFLRKQWPGKMLSIADRRTREEFPREMIRELEQDSALTLKLGPDYLDSLATGLCDVIIKTPGIPASIDPIAKAIETGSAVTSHSAIFLSNYPRQKIIGITGTKGKSTTASLIWHILNAAGLPAELVGTSQC